MAAPKPIKTTSKVLVKTAPAGKVNTPKVSKATGFTVGNQVVKATKSNPVTTSTPAAQKKAAGVQSAKAFTPAATKGQSPLDQLGGFIQSRVDQMTGKTPTPISGAMKNPTPVIPYTQKNIRAAKNAGWKP